MCEDLKAKVSHLKGFVEGIELEESSKEQKVLHKIVAVLDEITSEIELLRADYDDIFEYTEAIDDDLTELEDDFYDDDDDEFDEDYIDDFEGGFSIECPNCREIVVVGEDVLDQDTSIEVTCPGCGEAVLVDDEDWDESAAEEKSDS